MSQQKNYADLTAIKSGRTIFSNYVQRRQLVNQGELLGLNVYQPNHDASIMPLLHIGALNTTPAEIASYLSQVENNTTVPETPTVPGAPLSLCVLPSDSALTIYFLAGSSGSSPITNYKYSTDGITYTALSPAQTTSPITISGLTNGTVYSIYLEAVNSVGASDPSSAITAAPIPSTFDPTQISGLVLWLDGQNTENVLLASGQVSGWDDSSSGANDFTVSPTGVITYDFPSNINGRPALNFTTSGGTYLHKESFNITPGSNQITVFLIVNQTATGTGNSELFFTRNDYSYFDIFSNTNTTGLLSINARNDTQRSSGQDIITTPSTIAIISVTLSATAGYMYLNGTVTNVNNTAFTGLSLDAALDWSVSGGAFKGYIGEVVVYPSVLSSDDRQKVEGYLAWKWGLQANLPDANPWKTTPPTDETPPGAPTLTYILGGDTVAYVYYTAGTGTPTNYQLTKDVGTTYANFNPVDIISPNTVSGLTNSVSATLQLRAYNGGGYSSISNGLSVTPASASAPTEYLLFDPNDSSCYSGSGSTVNNIGSYGALAGTISGAVSYITGTGITAKVFNFTGGYINFGAFDFTSTFSVTAWIYPTEKSSINAILTNGPANANTPGFKFAWNSWTTTNHNLIFEDGDGTAGNWYIPSTVNNTVTMGVWQHVAVVFNQASRAAVFLVNGLPVSVAGIQTATNVTVSRPNFSIGRYVTGGYTMRAQLGRLSVFNSSLNAAEVLADYEATKSTFGL